MYAGFMSNPAPGALEIVRSFVNTLDIDHDVEELAGASELVSWLGGHGLLGPDAPPDVQASAADLRRAIELREALRAQLRAHHGEPDSTARSAGCSRSSRRRSTTAAGRA